jgi:hypothetical protein
LVSIRRLSIGLRRWGLTVTFLGILSKNSPVTIWKNSGLRIARLVLAVKPVVQMLVASRL